MTGIIFLLIGFTLLIIAILGSLLANEILCIKDRDKKHRYVVDNDYNLEKRVYPMDRSEEPVDVYVLYDHDKCKGTYVKDCISKNLVDKMDMKFLIHRIKEVRCTNESCSCDIVTGKRVL